MYELRTKGAKAAERDYRTRTQAGLQVIKTQYTSHELTAAINAYDARMAGLKAGVVKL